MRWGPKGPASPIPSFVVCCVFIVSLFLFCQFCCFCFVFSCVCVGSSRLSSNWWRDWGWASPLPLVSRGGRLPQRLKGRLAFLFKEKEGITFLDKGKELLAPVLDRVAAVFPLKRVTDVRQRLWMAAPEAAQDKRRKTHGSTESCHERQELLKEELSRAESQPLSQHCSDARQTQRITRQGWI